MKKRILFLITGLLFVATNFSYSQVGIGTEDPDKSAILDVTSDDKGVLLPRVPLTSTTDVLTVTDPAKGLMVFNTGEAGLTYVGYVFWNGSEWRSLTSGSLAPGTIGGITCNDVSLTPGIYEAGKEYEGTMIVPYTGGNGGVYEAQTIGPVNGLTATLAAGNFNVGAGSLAYTITGTPAVSSPTTTAFDISIGGKVCEAVIGAGDVISLGELVYYQTPPIPANARGTGSGAGDDNSGYAENGWLSYYTDDLPVIGGKLRLDGYMDEAVSGPGSVPFNPRLVNISDENVKLWFSAMTTVDNFNTANLVLKPKTWVNLDNGIYNSFGVNSTLSNPSGTSSSSGGISVAANHTEVVTLDLSLDNKWYRIYYYPIVDNNEQTTVANMSRRIYMSIQRLY